jgi:hypothetical protein
MAFGPGKFKMLAQMLAHPKSGVFSVKSPFLGHFQPEF